MDIQKYLVIIKNEDKTDNILHYELDKNYIYIQFKNNVKTYTYLRKDVEFYKQPMEINIQNYKIMLNQGYLFNLEKIIKFEKYYRLFFQNHTSIVIPESNLELLENNNVETLSMNKFEYYKEVSKIVSVKTEEGNELLTKLYETVNFIEKDTALYKYLNPKEGIHHLKTDLNSIIFPFGANKSQFQAVKNAMSSQISIIEGPPGTGKTQTILNIIANIVKSGKTVAVVSNNNAATDNVYEKLKKYNLDYLCARLGKRENKEEFIKNQTGKYPDLAEKLENEEVIEQELNILNQDITKIFDVQNEIAKLKEELNETELQHQYFKKYEESHEGQLPKIRNINRISSNTIMKLKVEYEELQNISLWFRIKSQLFYGIGNTKFYQQNRKNIIQSYSKLFFLVREIELKNKIQNNQKQLRLLGGNKLEQLMSHSLKILHEYLRKRYSQHGERKIFNITNLYNDSTEFNKEYPIVFSTTYSIRKCLNENYKFDYIIMDESSQVDLITGVLALSVAKNAVIVGDLKQLPNVITTENKHSIEEISKKYQIQQTYNYLEHSFLSSISNTVVEAPRTLLKEHYRCHPKIIQFCNKKFYDNELIIMTEDKGEKDVLKAYITIPGNHARGHWNQRQIDVIEKEVIPELIKEIDIKDIGVISPYREQKKELEKKFDTQLKVDTIHKFQGREEEAIIITTVDNEIGEFVDDPKMLNVAVTRAKRFLRLVVSNNEKNIGTNIDDLIKYIQYNNFEIVESKTKSIYDLLYKANRIERMECLKKKKKISEYNSENLTYSLIDEIIKENHFHHLDIAVHVPLMDVLASTDLLDEEEIKYATNVWTHIDFVIFNKMDKKLLIAIEVDGYYYHKEGTKQQEKDMLKNKILDKYDVPLIRLKTTGSGEKEILENKIKEIFIKS